MRENMYLGKSQQGTWNRCGHKDVIVTKKEVCLSICLSVRLSVCVCLFECDRVCVCLFV